MGRFLDEVEVHPKGSFLDEVQDTPEFKADNFMPSSIGENFDTPNRINRLSSFIKSSATGPHNMLFKGVTKLGVGLGKEGIEKPEALLEIPKAAARATEQFGAGVAGVFTIINRVVDMNKDRIDLLQKFAPFYNQTAIDNIQKLAPTLAQWGKKGKDFLTEESMRGWEAPDPEIFAGSFLENPSFIRGAAVMTGALPSLAGALLISGATGSPLVGAAVLGSVESEDLYFAKKDAGGTEAEALSLFALGTVGSTLLEFAGLKAIKGGAARILARIPKAAVIERATTKIGKNSRRILLKYLNNRITKAPISKRLSALTLAGLGEGSTEGLQEIWNNAVTKLGIDRSQNLLEGVVESFIGGFGGGGIAMAGMSFVQKSQAKKNLKRKISEFKKVLDEAEKDGVDLDQFILATEKGMINKHKEIDKTIDTEVNDNLQFINDMKEAEVKDVEEKAVEEEEIREDEGVVEVKELEDIVEKQTIKDLSGRAVRVGDSPQRWTVVKKLEPQPGDLDFEVFYEVKNDKTGELQIVELEDISLIKGKLKAKEVEIPTEKAKRGKEKLVADIERLMGIKIGVTEDISEKRLQAMLDNFSKLRVDEASKIVSRALLKRIPKAKTKGIVRKTTGLAKDVVSIGELSLLKEKFKNIEKGARLAKAEIKTVQDEAIKLFKDAGLDVPISIRNIKTQKQLKKALPIIKERVARLEERFKKDKLVKEIERAEKVEVPQDYRDQIDDVLEGIELKRRTEATKKARESRLEFLERQQAEGSLVLLPRNFFDNLPKKTLDEMTVEELEFIRDTISLLSKVGQTKNKMLSLKHSREITNFVNDVVQKGYDKVGISETFDKSEDIRFTPRKTKLQQSKQFLDGIFASHRKVEFVMKFLNGLEVTELIHRGRRKQLALQEKVYKKLGDSLRNLGDLKKVQKEKGLFGLTREQMIGVTLNSGNQGNLERLVKGNKITIEQINQIKEDLTDTEKAFVKDIFELLDSLFPEMSKVTENLTGLRPKKVAGQYFPIIPDYELSKQAAFREEQQNLFQDIFEQTYVAHTFAKKRAGGNDPVNLNSLEAIMRHLDGVIHYTAFGESVRDAQKVINDPRFKNMVTTIYDEQVYEQFPTWLRSIANPKAMKLKGVLAWAEKGAKGLRNNATTTLLGVRLTVSMVQAGSYTQTIKEIGAKEATNAVLEYLSDKKGVTEFVFENSINMRNRQGTFDRDIKDDINSGKLSKLTQNKPGHKEMLFYMIQSVDMATTIPTWIGSYNQKYAETFNKQKSIEFADFVVRTTQPSGLTENLANIMKGSEFQKMFTMFMSHFSNVHNQIVLSLDELKMSKDHPLRKIKDFARSMWFLWLLPAFLTGLTKNLGDLKRTAADVITYPFAGMIIARDVVNIFKGFGFGAPPAFASFNEMGKAFKTKAFGKKVKAIVKSVGILTGIIPTQAVDTVTGALDLISGETDNWMRLFFSEWAVKGSGISIGSRD